jgi:hypothetical protein
MDELAITDDRTDERAARLAMNVVRHFAAKDQSVVIALVRENLANSMPANGLNAEPVVLRQLEQWQLAA